LVEVLYRNKEIKSKKGNKIKYIEGGGWGVLVLRFLMLCVVLLVRSAGGGEVSGGGTHYM
jgi:hypothetical protein